MSKRKLYMVLDTETATLPFVKQLCHSAEEIKKIAIAKPIVYDIGWVISQRDGKIIEKKNYLVQETFFVPQVFNTAYYADKRPIYIDLLNKGAIQVKDWNDIIQELLEDLQKVEIVAAFNACFDFKKAIPFTERYIKNLYSNDYQKWEDRQYKQCKKILKGIDDSENPDYLIPMFHLRDKNFPILDLWGASCEKLGEKYKEFCLKSGRITASGIYFSTSAESVFAYYSKKEDFLESHTALDDSCIENELLKRVLHDKGAKKQIKAFPFRDLGTTCEFIAGKTSYYKYAESVLKAMSQYINGKFESINEIPENAYWNGYLNKFCAIIDIMKEEEKRQKEKESRKRKSK